MKMSLVEQVVAPIVAEIELRQIAISIVHDKLAEPATAGASPKRWSWAHEALVMLEVEMADLRLRYEIAMAAHRRAARELARAARRQGRKRSRAARK